MRPKTSNSTTDIHARIGDTINHNAHLPGKGSSNVKKIIDVATMRHNQECLEMNSPRESVTPNAVRPETGY